MKIIILVFSFLSCISLSAQDSALDTNHGLKHTKSVESNSIKHSHSNHHHYGDHWEIPSQNPDRIILTFYGNPSSQRAVTWRTDSTIEYAVAQISIAGKNSKFEINAKTYRAKTEELKIGDYHKNKDVIVHYHSVIFENLIPETLYAYRVGNGKIWSEWIHFKTSSNDFKPTEFVYFGDAQNNILSHWSRVIRMAYQKAPNASFAIYAGDLVNYAHLDNEWAQWFKAGGFIHSQWTAIPVVGNHEFGKILRENEQKLSLQWRPQFTLPVEKSLDEKLHETVYSINYQDILIIVLNSSEMLEQQTAYVEKKLMESDAKWKIITCHHSVFSPAPGRDFEYGRKFWKPLFDKFNVDLVLNGHDHTYARGHVPVKSRLNDENGNLQTMYITSVSGPKQYNIDKDQINNYKVDDYTAEKTGENTQFFQVFQTRDNKLIYAAYTATGDLYDKVTIVKDFDTGTKTHINLN